MQMHVIGKRLTRQAVRAASLLLPEQRGLALERWRRGREDAWKLRRSQALFVSYGKSGRTWVRVMMSRYYQQTRRLPEHTLLGFDNYHRLDSTVPTVFFTHDNYVRAYLGESDSRAPFYPYPTVLLTRNPQDVAVSQFFQWKFRMRPYKKSLNDYPAHGADVALFDYVMESAQGIDRVIDFLNDWIRALPHFQRALAVRYEDLRAVPARELTRIMTFLGETVNTAAIEEAVAFASVERMREMESRNYFWRSGSRVQARDPGNPDSYKVRKAKVGGYRDYFDDAQIAAIDARVNARLLAGFGYTAAEESGVTVAVAAREASG